MFGGNHLYVFAHPAKMAKKKKKQQQEVTYEMAQAEIAANSGIMRSVEDSQQGKQKSKGLVEKQSCLAVSEEMKKPQRDK